MTTGLTGELSGADFALPVIPHEEGVTGPVAPKLHPQELIGHTVVYVDQLVQRVTAAQLQPLGRFRATQKEHEQ